MTLFELMEVIPVNSAFVVVSRHRTILYEQVSCLGNEQVTRLMPFLDKYRNCIVKSVSPDIIPGDSQRYPRLYIRLREELSSSK